MRMKNAPLQLVRGAVAEAVGTLVLAAVAVTASLSQANGFTSYNGLYVPFAVGAVVMVLVYLLGPLSGAMFNPAVTVALFAFRKVTVQQLVLFLLAQLVGAWAGVKLAATLVGISPSEPVVVTNIAALAEFVGAFFLVFAITMVVLGKVQAVVGGLVIGAALALGLTVAMASGAGILNPAIALALGGTSVTYLLMPFLGALCGAALAVVLDDGQTAIN